MRTWTRILTLVKSAVDHECLERVEKLERDMRELMNEFRRQQAAIIALKVNTPGNLPIDEYEHRLKELLVDYRLQWATLRVPAEILPFIPDQYSKHEFKASLTYAVNFDYCMD